MTIKIEFSSDRAPKQLVNIAKGNAFVIGKCKDSVFIKINYPIGNSQGVECFSLSNRCTVTLDKSTECTEVDLTITVSGV